MPRPPRVDFPGAWHHISFAIGTRRFRLALIIKSCRSVDTNPVVARLVPEPEAWRWSSAAAYVGDTTAPRWLRTDAVFDFFGTGDRLSGYRDFMTAGTDKGTADFFAKLGW